MAAPSVVPSVEGGLGAASVGPIVDCSSGTALVIVVGGKVSVVCLIPHFPLIHSSPHRHAGPSPHLQVGGSTVISQTSALFSVQWSFTRQEHLGPHSSSKQTR